MSGSYFLYCSILEKCGNFRKNGRFSGRIWPDWGNTTWADMAGLGSIGLNLAENISHHQHYVIKLYINEVSKTIMQDIMGRW